MPKEEVREFHEILEETKLPCSDHWARHDAFRRSKIFSKDKSQKQQEEIFRIVSEFIGSFPKGNVKSFDPTNYAVALYNLMCIDNGLSQKGVVWFLQAMLRTSKQLPTIADITKALDDLNLNYDEFERSYEFFLRMCARHKEQFVDMYNNSSAAKNLLGVLDIEEAIDGYEIIFPYDPLPGVFNEDTFNEEEAKKVIDALSLPKEENPLLLILLT